MLTASTPEHGFDVVAQADLGVRPNIRYLWGFGDCHPHLSILQFRERLLDPLTRTLHGVEVVQFFLQASGGSGHNSGIPAKCYVLLVPARHYRYPTENRTEQSRVLSAPPVLVFVDWFSLQVLLAIPTDSIQLEIPRVEQSAEDEAKDVCLTFTLPGPRKFSSVLHVMPPLQAVVRRASTTVSNESFTALTAFIELR